MAVNETAGAPSRDPPPGDSDGVESTGDAHLSAQYLITAAVLAQESLGPEIMWPRVQTRYIGDQGRFGNLESISGVRRYRCWLICGTIACAPLTWAWPSHGATLGGITALEGDLIIIHLLGLAPEGGWLHRTTARSAVEAARPLRQPVPLSAIEPALRGRSTNLNRGGGGRNCLGSRFLIDPGHRTIRC
jgi:hypothetical protein